MKLFSAPKFQSKTDEVNQREVMSTIAEKFSVITHEEPEGANMDFYIERSTVPGILHPCEVKCRNTQKAQYPTFMISHSKWLIGKEDALKKRSRFFIFIRFTDGLYFTDETEKLDTGTRYVANGGRTDRGVDSDQERMIYIPHRELHKI